MGFVLPPEEAQALIKKDKRNREVLFPYLNGEDLNSRPDQSPSRWVINFFDWPLEKAETYKGPMRIIREKVKPERDGYTKHHINRSIYWWQFAEKAPKLYSIIAGLERVLVTSRVSQFFSWALVPSKQVLNERLTIVIIRGLFPVLQSTLSEAWMLKYGSTLETRPMYTPSDCFETFPFPAKLDRLDKIGKRYDEHRQSIMQDRQEGLTKTYNRMHDQKETTENIERLRKLHVCCFPVYFGRWFSC